MRTFIYILLLAITACSKAPSPRVPATFTSQSQTGLAIGTITFEGEAPKNDIYRFFYAPTTGDKNFIKKNRGKVQILGRVNGERTYTGDFNNKKTYLFAIERAPGQYAFNQYNYLTRKGPTGMVYPSKQFTIPFELKKGEISYMGEFTYIEKAEPGTPRIIVADYMARDIEQFKQKFPNINWEAAKNTTPKSGNTGEGIIDFR